MGHALAVIFFMSITSGSVKKLKEIINYKKSSFFQVRKNILL
jgi:hypothetical protein